MNLILCQIGVLILFYVIVTEGRADKGRVKIIVPHKISYIHHHHHHGLRGERTKMKKLHYKTQFKAHHFYDEDDEGSSQEENDEEFGYNDSEEDKDSTKEDVLVYTISASKLAKLGGNIVMKPLVLYKSDGSHRSNKLHRNLNAASSILRHNEIIRPRSYKVDGQKGHAYASRAFPGETRILKYRVDF